MNSSLSLVKIQWILIELESGQKKIQILLWLLYADDITLECQKKYKNKKIWITSDFYAIWLIFKPDRDLMARNIFQKFGEDRMKTDKVREQTKTCEKLTYLLTDKTQKKNA